MLKQTIILFIKATIIGILINVGLKQMPNTSVVTDNNITLQSETVVIEQPAHNTIELFAK